MNATINTHLCSLADGRLGISIPTTQGGSGGSLRDLFEAVSKTGTTSAAAARIYAVQRHFAEVLLSCENVAMAEYWMPYILGGEIPGACTVTWPEGALASPAHLVGRPVGSGSVLQGRLHPAHNIGEDWYVVTALLRPAPGAPPSLVLLTSEQDGLHRMPVGENDYGDDLAVVSANNVFFRGDEIIQDDVSAKSGYLTRFGAFLRCAIAAGEANEVITRNQGRDFAARRDAIDRTVNNLLDAAEERLPTLTFLGAVYSAIHGAVDEPTFVHA